MIAIRLLMVLVALMPGVPAAAAPPRGVAVAPASTPAPRDFRSPRFLLHTDLAPQDAQELLKRLETMMDLVAAYWGRPLRGVIEAYVVDDLGRWNTDLLDPVGLAKIRANSGVCLTLKQSRGQQWVAKSVVYATARHGVVQHESIHAYCHQTFGRAGPIWYCEGMAEVGQYWEQGNKDAVNAFPHVIRYLKSTPPRPFAELLAETKHSGDWQDYAWWWALCHLLGTNPNYAPQFRPLGMSLLLGRDVSFEQVYGPVARQIEFEYLFFLKHMDRGYRSDLCAWDWRKPFRMLRTSPRPVAVKILAGRGWQPTGVGLVAGVEYDVAASGRWKTSKDGAAVGPEGDPQGAGRLEGVLLRDFTLGEPFELGATGTIRPDADGNLYLRCRDAWNELADNTGQMTVKIQVHPNSQPQGR